jgi:hypothetical protein
VRCAETPKTVLFMNAPDTQVLFFQHLKAVMPPHLSLVDEVADLLGISPDSAYRRIRGEKPISLEEVRKLCLHNNLSIDHMLNLRSDYFIFSGRLKEGEEQSFDLWMDDLYQKFQYVSSLKHTHLYSLLKDISPFVHFQIPELATFKFYLWTKSILHHENMKHVKFDFKDPRYDSYTAKGKKIIDLYNRIPTSEIWNVESINSTLRQIHFHYEAGSFRNKLDAKLLYNKVEELLDHIEMEAEAGLKFNIGEKPNTSSAEFQIYVNELILGDNTILVETDTARMTFLNHSVLYFVHTTDEKFNAQMYEHFQIIMKKSTLISKVGEKERAGFFNRLREEVQQRILSL